ncbi:MAG: Omp28 family outer membrane lipoprotein [Candidatus Aphodosoma sp.]
MNFKKVFLFLLILPFMYSCEVIKEDDRLIEVELAPSNRVVLLTEFTGWACVNCPDAAAVANEIIGLCPDNIIVVGMHPDGHGFTELDPNGKALDLRSKEAMDYLKFYGGSQSTGLPAGVINGTKFDGDYIQVYNKWTAIVMAQRAIEPSYSVSLAKSGSDRDYTIKVNINPLIDNPSDNVSLQLWLLESNIIGLQRLHDGYDENYHHNHVFRKCLNSLWGDELGIISAEMEKEYSVTIDEAYVPENCSVVAVLINTDTKEVFQAAEIAFGESIH